MAMAGGSLWHGGKAVLFHDLAGGLEHVLFFHILGMVTPTDEVIFFRGVGQPPTSDVLFTLW